MTLPAGVTDAQLRALRAMPFEYMTWGGKLFGSLPHGIRSRNTLEALRAKGLARTTLADRATTKWHITDKGRAMIAAAVDGGAK